MEKRTNIIHSLAKYPHLNQDEKDLVERLSYLDPKFADYCGVDEFPHINQLLRTNFKLENKVESKDEFENRLILEGILTNKDSIEIGETIPTEYGVKYFLSSKNKDSMFAVYFVNPEQ